MIFWHFSWIDRSFWVKNGKKNFRRKQLATLSQRSPVKVKNLCRFLWIFHLQLQLRICHFHKNLQSWQHCVRAWCQWHQKSSNELKIYVISYHFSVVQGTEINWVASLPVWKNSTLVLKSFLLPQTVWLQRPANEKNLENDVFMKTQFYQYQCWDVHSRWYFGTFHE